ncbi:hypothetical protein ACFL42_00450 [Candidatus Omnitrophota bacterium]
MGTMRTKKTLKKQSMVSILSLFLAGIFMAHSGHIDKGFDSSKKILGDNIPFTLIDGLNSKR